jgi:hypothetical protein
MLAYAIIGLALILMRIFCWNYVKKRVFNILMGYKYGKTIFVLKISMLKLCNVINLMSMKIIEPNYFYMISVLGLYLIFAIVIHLKLNQIYRIYGEDKDLT